MSRLWSSGFELNSTTNGVEWNDVSGSPTIQTTTVRSGTYALQISSLVSGTGKYVLYTLNDIGTQGPLFFRVYVRFATFPSAENIFIGDDNLYFYLTIDNIGVVRLYDEDGQIGSGSSALSLNTWYRIEIQYDKTPVAGSHVIRAKIDGTEFAGSNTRNLAFSIFGFMFGGNIGSEGNTTGNWFFDDIAINDSTGSFQNSYPGEGEIIHLRPNATGDNSAWTGDNTDIDEVTPDDATTYIEAIEDGTDIEDVNIDATPAALASDDTINVVQVGVRHGAVGVAGADPEYALRIKASSGGTVEESSTITITAAAFATNGNANPHNYLLTLYDLPGASTTAWTKADLDTAQIGVHAVTTIAELPRISTLWLLVDHKPAAVGGISATTSDTATISETIGRLLTSIVSVSDTATVSETIGRLMTSLVAIADSVALSEPISMMISDLQMSESESILISEALNAALADQIKRTPDQTVQGVRIVTPNP
jgi:hypothetical protein